MTAKGLLFKRAKDIKSFWLFRHDLKAYLFQQELWTRSSELTRRAGVLWDTLGEPLHRYYKQTAKYYKELLRQRSSGDCLYLEAVGRRLIKVMNFVFNRRISTYFTGLIRSWDSFIHPDHMTCFTCSYFEKGSPSWNAIGRCFALGLSEEDSVVLCQQCLTLREEFTHLISQHSAVYRSVDELISSTKHEEFVTHFLNDIALDIVGEKVMASTGQIMAILSCCFRAGVLWRKADESVVIQQVKYTDDVLKFAYQWDNLFNALERRKSSKLKHLIDEFKFFLGLAYTDFNKIPGGTLGIKKVKTHDGSQDKTNDDVIVGE